MKNIILILIAAIGFTNIGCTQSVKHKNKTTKPSTLSVVFYNVENLYDTKNDPQTDDDEFTPQGRIPWTEERFEKKLGNISQVLSDISKPGLPDIVGLAEIENKFVLESLTKSEKLKSAAYNIVHFNSDDERGIDVAMLYNPKTFTVIQSLPLKVVLPDNDNTRDILYVKGKTTTGEVLNVFINHWPSRREGTEISEPKRMAAAKVLRSKIDEILKNDINANIVIMGDFNDEPSNKSIVNGIGATKAEPKFKPSALYSLLYNQYQKGDGSLFYQDWDLFDQIIVSGNMLSRNKGIRTSVAEAGIFKVDYLLFYDKKANESKPNRTMGSKYFGGYSDHLPVFVNFKL